MRALPRHPWDLLLLGATTFGITLTWALYSAAPRTVTTVAKVVPPSVPSVASAPDSPSPTQAAFTPPTVVDNIDDLIAAATGDRADQRLAAITALADAPRARALPMLLRIARTGIVVADRHAALESLLVQAVQQPVAEDPIPDLLRDLTYDGNDEEVSEHAAQVLEQLNATEP